MRCEGAALYKAPADQAQSRRRQDAEMPVSSARSVAMFRQPNFEKLSIAIGNDDRRIGWFSTPRQFACDPPGVPQCRGGVCKYLADSVLDTG
jgi:hypothetical protein